MTIAGWIGEEASVEGTAGMSPSPRLREENRPGREEGGATRGQSANGNVKRDGRRDLRVGGESRSLAAS